MKAPDMSGRRFGKWRVIKPLEKQHGAAVWECVCDCGIIRGVLGTSLRAGKTKSCGCVKRSMIKSAAANWRGGRLRTVDGYIRVHVGNSESGKSAYRMEHQLVMEEYLKRPLLPEETVHHLNGVRDDNRIENLELWSKSHPYGQRVEDKIKWAKEILRVYENKPIGD